MLQCSYKNKNEKHQSHTTLFNEWHYNATCFNSQGIIKQFIKKTFKTCRIGVLMVLYELPDDDSLGTETCSIVECH